jgi:undecaprenyl diphosphate synthase
LTRGLADAPEPTADADGDGRPGAVPVHVAIIMDGNGRWARERGWPRIEGHRAGTDNIRRVLRAFSEHGVEYVTLFTFSTENWGRPDDEVSALMELMRDVIYEEVRRLHEEGVRMRHFGRLDRLPPALQQAMQDGIELTKDNTRITVNIAFDYGGRAEIVNAVRAMVADCLGTDEITESAIDRYLYTSGTPDPDLIIRTAGEMRLSNFLLWQAAYAEYYSTEVLWPDFDETETIRALEAYAHRRRRYGKVDGP